MYGCAYFRADLHPVDAPNNGTPKTPKQCASEALKKNAVALTLDVAGVGAGFLTR